MPGLISFQAILEMMASSMAAKLQGAQTVRCVCDRNQQVHGERAVGSTS
jgi:hypothetical protein